MATCITVQGKKCWFTTLDDGKKYVELTTLLYHLTRQRGDRALVSLLRRSGHLGSMGTVPDSIVGFDRLPFPGQRGHASDKHMPAVTSDGLEWLMGEMDDELLKTQCIFMGAVIAQLGGSAKKAIALRSRYPILKMIDGGDEAVHLSMRDGEVPRVVLYSLLKTFAPKYNPSWLFHYRGLKSYLQELNVLLSENLALDVTNVLPDAKFQDDDTATADAFKCDSILPYERQLAAKSRGVVLGSCAYNNGTPVLLVDFPIVVLILFRLKTIEARSLQIGNFHQGLVLMGGNEDVARAMAQHWRAERDATPSNQFLQFLGLAVEHEVTEPSSSGAVALTPEHLQQFISDLRQHHEDLRRELLLRHDDLHRDLVSSIPTALRALHLAPEAVQVNLNRSSRSNADLHRINLTIPTTNAERTILVRDTLQVTTYLKQKFAELNLSDVAQMRVVTSFRPAFSQALKVKMEIILAGAALPMVGQIGRAQVHYRHKDRPHMEEVWCSLRDLRQSTIRRIVRQNAASAAEDAARSRSRSRE